MLLPVVLRLEASTNWSEDITVNTAGSRNVKRSETRRAGVTATRNRLATGPLLQNLTAGWYYNNTAGVNLGDESEQTDTETTGAIRTGIPIMDGLSLATRLYGTQRVGDNALAGIDSPTETTGDTLGVGGYYNGLGMTGKVVFSQADFNRSYLDYRRDANGLVDTTNVPEGADKIVDELEAKDAWELSWDNKGTVGRFKYETKLSHKYDKQQYSQSLVGGKERTDDNVSLSVGVPVGRDSLAVTYKYQWTWDDQRFLNATTSRGRQYKKVRPREKLLKHGCGYTQPCRAACDLSTHRSARQERGGSGPRSIRRFRRPGRSTFRPRDGVLSGEGAWQGQVRPAPGGGGTEPPLFV